MIDQEVVSGDQHDLRVSGQQRPNMRISRIGSRAGRGSRVAFCAKLPEPAQDRFNLARRQSMESLYLRPQQNLAVFSQKVRRNQEGDAAGRHAGENAHRRCLRVRGQKSAHDHIGVDDEPGWSQ